VEIRVHARNTTLDEAFRDVVIDKLGHAARVFEHQLGDIDVEVTEEHNPRLAGERFRLELTSSAAGHVIRVVAAAGTPETALDLAEDRFNQQLRRLKERLIDRNRRQQPREPENQEPPDASNEIVRIKQFVMKPMTVEEASLQMEMLGHDFYFFLSAANSRQCVLYRRRDGRLGLIEPA
jgi:putative sigma-54 modulation protein